MSSTIISASWMAGRVTWVKVLPSSTWRLTASTTAGWQWPRSSEPWPSIRSRNRRPSVVYRYAPGAVGEEESWSRVLVAGDGRVRAAREVARGFRRFGGRRQRGGIHGRRYPSLPIARVLGALHDRDGFNLDNKTVKDECADPYGRTGRVAVPGRPRRGPWRSRRTGSCRSRMWLS